ncbi:OLC1v1004067C1 [Oldenlandia corymbosa var. corymbosa]|uniref:RBR-type E3 ubiquitin transferase n=1 Tax=Oldenlandia corymbosa var. corymbosa TaxID=529605 RepID=A0AAV1DCN7_OLDCO|nr:OLC1v1004067C1 [Oldenlandia corymbosa var. corymbosa]
MEAVEDLKTLLSEQSCEFAAAQAVDSDLCFAYQLQIQEAMAASLSQNGGVPGSSNLDFPVDEKATEMFSDDTLCVVAEEIALYEQQLQDQLVAEDEMKKFRDDLNRRIHDRAFAREILSIPEVEWEKTGDDVEKPYLEGSAPGIGMDIDNLESFRVHIKGLMGNETVGNGEGNSTFVGGIGVAVCDANDLLVFEVSKGVVGGEMSGEVVQVKALVEGLHVATILGLKKILLVCDSDLIHQFFAGKWYPTEGNLATLVGQVTLLMRNLPHCRLSLVAQNDVKFAFKLAQDAVVSQAEKLIDNLSGKQVIETCSICLEDINASQMFSVDGCMHRYCYPCMRRHVEVKLLYGFLPQCPHEHCKSELKTDDCKKFLTPELSEMMCQRFMEASIPAAEKVYCPYPSCSALMSRSEFVGDGLKLCKKCNRPFCSECGVIWHDNITCSEYKEKNPYPCHEDAELKSLATKSLWRQCNMCRVMVSLVAGCNHIYCRCGYEFCYICGAAWVNKRATCTCPLWDEQNIVYER